MSVETDLARLTERMEHVITRLDKIDGDVTRLNDAYNQSIGARWMIRLLGGTSVAGLGAGALKVIEWVSRNPPQPPYHP